MAIFQTFIAALMAFTGLSVHGATTRKYYDDNLGDQELKQFIGACLQVLMISSFMVFLIILIFIKQFSEWFDLQPIWILWAVVVSGSSFIVNICLGQWQARKMAKKYGALQISQSLINMVLSLVLVVCLRQGVEGRIEAQIWTSAIFSLVALVVLYKQNLLGFFTWRPVYIKEALAFGVPLIPHVAGMFLLNSIDRFVIDSELGRDQTGIYMVALQISLVMALVFDSINKAYVPWLFERLKRNIPSEKRQIVRYTYLYFVVALFMAALAFSIGPFLITILAGNRYSYASEVIGWLALGQAFTGMYSMVTNYIFYSKRTALLSLTTFFSGLINVILLLTLIKFFGLKGAAIAFSIAMLIRFLLTWYVAQLRHPMPWLDFRSSV